MFKKKHNFFLIFTLFLKLNILGFLIMDDLTHCQICFEQYDHNERIPKMLTACKNPISFDEVLNFIRFISIIYH